ncbi:MAG: endonuclease/exonuclease/phosphatase family protein [Bacteroidota bacterium]
MKNLRDFKVGSFNAYNLALPDQPYYDRKYSRAQYERKRNWIGDQLDQMRADIVGFQEIFHQEALEEAVRASDYMRPAKIIMGKRNGHSPAVALATRFEVLSHEVIVDFPEPLQIDDVHIPITQFSRPVLHALVKVKEGVEISVFVVHLKSKRPMIPEGVKDPHHPLERAKGQARSLIRRAAEASALRSLLMKYLFNRDHPVILLGDVNDGGTAVTTQIISGEPPHRNFPREVKEKIWDVLLYHARDIQARQSYEDFYYSHIHNGHYESLDHIMVSQELVAQNPNHIGSIGYVSVLTDHLIDETLSDERIGYWQSDHGQVVASIELRN